MVDIKGLGGVKLADKTKAKARTGAAGGPSFASLLEEAQAAEDASALESAAPLSLPAGYVPLEEEDPDAAPRNPKQQAQELLKTLQTLAEDALSGSPTATLNRLEQLTAQIDESGLTQLQKDALDEARTRAAVEAAKLKG